MRFGKRHKSWTAAGRHLLGNRSEESKSGSLAQDERSALLGWGEGDEFGVDACEATLQDASARSRDASLFDAPDAHDDAIKGDPTQHLLTALGRFQRQVARAEHGVPDVVWADECMNQIVAGIEIAIAQGWEGVQEALTDTARILHSYEQAGQADACISFLQGSYEILCLMVGDLIVDNIRSGVLQKWRMHYQRGVDELLRAGIPLTQDEEEEEKKTEVAPEASPSAIHTREDCAAASTALDEIEPEAGDTPAAETPLEIPERESCQGKATATVEKVVPDETLFDNSPFSLPEETREPMPDMSAMSSAEVPVEATDIPEESEDIFAASAASEDNLTKHGEPEAEEVEVTDSMMESSVGDEVLKKSTTPGFAPAEEDAPAWSDAAAVAEEAAPLDTTELPPETPAQHVASSEENDLFRSVQQAMARGAVSEAKGMALRLAAHIARMEVEQERQKMATAEKRLQEFAAAIEAAREEARCAELRAQEIEERTVQCDQEMQEHRRRIAELRDKTAAAQKRIEAIEEQIRELETQRDAMLAEAANLGGELEEALAAESRLQTDLDGLADMESAARESTALARRNLEAMESEQKDREAEAALARTQLEERFKSAEEIDRTLSRILGDAHRSGEETELLF